MRYAAGGRAGDRSHCGLRCIQIIFLFCSINSWNWKQLMSMLFQIKWEKSHFLWIEGEIHSNTWTVSTLREHGEGDKSMHEWKPQSAKAKKQNYDFDSFATFSDSSPLVVPYIRDTHTNARWHILKVMAFFHSRCSCCCCCLLFAVCHSIEFNSKWNRYISSNQQTDR